MLHLYILSFLLLFSLSIVAEDGDLDDPNVSFNGRWNMVDFPGKYVSNWPGAHVIARFTGRNIAVSCDLTEAGKNTMDVKNKGIFRAMVKIDDLDDVLVTSHSCPVILGKDLAPGSHWIRLTSDTGLSIHFRKFLLDKDEFTLPDPAEMPQQTVEFIGDGSTTGADTSQNILTSYGWQMATKFNLIPHFIAQNGIALMSGEETMDYNLVGMEEQYSRLGSGHNPDRGKRYNFDRYGPQYVVVNLGSNDFSANEGAGVSAPKFKRHLKKFLRDIQQLFGSAEIYALRPFKGYLAEEVEGAINLLRDEGSEEFHYIDTTGWVDEDNFQKGKDNSFHPNDKGHKQIAEQLIEVFRPLIEVEIGLDPAEVARLEEEEEKAKKESKENKEEKKEKEEKEDKDKKEEKDGKKEDEKKKEESKEDKKEEKSEEKSSKEKSEDESKESDENKDKDKDEKAEKEKEPKEEKSQESKDDGEKKSDEASEDDKDNASDASKKDDEKTSNSRKADKSKDKAPADPKDAADPNDRSKTTVINLEKEVPINSDGGKKQLKFTVDYTPAKKEPQPDLSWLAGLGNPFQHHEEKPSSHRNDVGPDSLISGNHDDHAIPLDGEQTLSFKQTFDRIHLDSLHWSSLPYRRRATASTRSDSYLLYAPIGVILFLLFRFRRRVSMTLHRLTASHRT